MWQTPALLEFFDSKELRHCRECIPLKGSQVYGCCSPLLQIVIDVDEKINLIPHSSKTREKIERVEETWFSTEKEARKAIQEFESATLSRFTCTRSQGYDISKGRVKWVDCYNTPYIICRNTHLRCKFGRKQKKLSNSQTESHEDSQQSAEVCNASITLLEVVTFPQYQLPSKMLMERKRASEVIRSNLVSGSDVLTKVPTFCVKFPALDCHTCQAMDKHKTPTCASQAIQTTGGVTEINIEYSNGEIPTDSNVILWTNTLDDAFLAIEQFEISTLTKFIYRRKHTCDITKSRVHWDELTNTPYIIVRSKQLECQHGRDRNKANNEKRRLTLLRQKSEQDEVPPKKKQGSKKHGCKAFISIHEVWKFPQHRIYSLSDYLKTKASRAIRKALSEEDCDLATEYYCQVKFPANGDHSGHLIGEAAGFQQTVDQRIIAKINELVQNGIYHLGDIQSALAAFVQGELFKDQPPPLHSNRRFYPTVKDIRNHLYKAIGRRNAPSKVEVVVESQEFELAEEVSISVDDVERLRKIDLLTEVQGIADDATSPPGLAQTDRDLANIIVNLSNTCPRETTANGEYAERLKRPLPYRPPLEGSPKRAKVNS